MGWFLFLKRKIQEGLETRASHAPIGRMFHCPTMSIERQRDSQHHTPPGRSDQIGMQVDLNGSELCAASPREIAGSRVGVTSMDPPRVLIRPFELDLWGGAIDYCIAFNPILFNLELQFVDRYRKRKSFSTSSILYGSWLICRLHGDLVDRPLWCLPPCLECSWGERRVSVLVGSS